MPHVVVKMYKGRSEEQKKTLAEGIKGLIKDTIGTPDEYISVSVEEFEPSDWPAVVREEIDGKPDNLYLKGGRLVK